MYREPSRRAPHGARGLKLWAHSNRVTVTGRAPHGARGLKRIVLHPISHTSLSRPTRGAWIETLRLRRPRHCEHVAPHTGRVD